MRPIALACPVFYFCAVMMAEAVRTRNPLSQYPEEIQEVIQKCGLERCGDPYGGTGCKDGCKCSPKPNYASKGMCTVAGKNTPSSLYDQYQHLIP